MGDAFMVAFPTVGGALAFMERVQATFLELDWPDDLLEAPSCLVELGPDGDVMWRGLRVRMGAHVGPADVEYQPHLRRVDYFGPTVNCAARVQSRAHGGQCLISGRLAESADPALHPRLRPLGTCDLKGIRDPVAVFEFVTVPGREFPPLAAAAESPAPPDREHYGAQACSVCLRPLRCRACRPLLHLSPKSSFDSPRCSVRGAASDAASLERAAGAASFRTTEPLSPARSISWLRNVGKNPLRSPQAPPHERERTTSTVSLGSDGFGGDHSRSTMQLLPGQPAGEGGERDPEKFHDLSRDSTPGSTVDLIARPTAAETGGVPADPLSAPPALTFGGPILGLEEGSDAADASGSGPPAAAGPAVAAEATRLRRRDSYGLSYDPPADSAPRGRRISSLRSHLPV